MDIEQKQAEHIDYFVKQASTLNGSALTNLVVEATSHPSLFAFSEILSLPNLLQVLTFSIYMYMYIFYSIFMMIWFVGFASNCLWMIF